MARQMTDIRLDEEDELVIEAGDFRLDESTREHQRQLLLNNKGDFKENPTVCVGAFSYLDDENYQGLIRAVNVEFTRDGMEVAEVRLTAAGTVISNAIYK